MKRIISMLLCIVMIFSLVSGVGPVHITEAAGNAAAFSPTQADRMTTTTTFTTAPRTFEATIELSKDTNRGGVILGGYGKTNTDIFNFEVHNYGNPQLYYRTASGTVYTYKFQNVDLRQEKSIRLTIVHDTTEVRCYLDGVLVETLEASSEGVKVSDLPKFNFTELPVVGGDYRTATNGTPNTQFFKGKIYDVAVWTDVRTGDEITNSSIDTIDKTDEDLFAAYNFSLDDPNQDLSSNDNDINESLPITDGAFKATTNSRNTLNTITKSFADYTYRPRTFEATIKLPDGYSDRGGVIVGSYGLKNNDAFNFEVQTDGEPVLYYWSSELQKGYSVRFDKVHVNTGEPVKLTIVHGEKITCYLGGSEAQVKDVLDWPSLDFKDAPVVGGDFRSNTAGTLNLQYFKGYIYDVAVWSDVRTAEEIATSSIDKIDKTDDKLLIAYDFSSVNPSQDLSSNKNHLTGGNLNIVTVDGIHTNTSTTQGLNFEDSNRVYQTEKELTGKPYTLSSWIYLPTDYIDAGGVILGNYHQGDETCVNFEILENGVPRFYHLNSDLEKTDLKFTGTNICADQWVNLTYVVDDVSNTVSCYLNGVLRETKTSENDIRMSDIKIPYNLGGDLRPKNTKNFKGRILELAMYENILSSVEVGQLYLKGVSELEKESFGYYTLTDATPETDIQDTTDYENDFITKLRFFSEKAEVTDYAYSFAVIGDTQKVTDYDAQNGTDHLAGIYDWILENKEDKKIKYVFGLGDITEHKDTTYEKFNAEWTLAKEQISRLNGNIPYSLVRGNHDELEAFNTNLGVIYQEQLENGDFYKEGDICNSWRTFTVGSVDYLMLTLDFGAKDEVLTWAGEIIEEHPTHNVIITTHAYMFRDGTTLDSGDVYPPTQYDKANNNGDHMWDELVSKYENIVLVMSGHDPYDKIVVSQEQGEHGNTVTQMLIDPQDVDIKEGTEPIGMVAMLYFSEDGSQMQVEYFSTVRNQFFLEENQFTKQIDVVDSATFTSAWVDIEDSLALNYKVKLTGDAAKEIPVITINGPGADVEKVPMTKVSGEVNTWTYRYSDIMAQEMADAITATVSAGDETATKTYSVLEYCKAVLEKEDDTFTTEYGYTTEQCAAVRELIVDLVQYGGQVQQYRSATDTLSQEVANYANYDTNFNLVALSELESLRELTVNTEDTTYQWSGATLTLKEKINIRAKFQADSIDNLKVQIKVGNTIKEEAAVITKASNGTYYVYFDGVCADQYGDEITFTFIDESTSQSIGKTLHYSVNSYLKNMSANETVSNLLSAINEYGHAAKAFVSLMNDK